MSVTDAQVRKLMAEMGKHGKIVPIPEPRTEEPGARQVRMQGAATKE